MLYLVAIVIGAAAGLMGALCGVGGGIILVPGFLYAFQMQQKNAIATSLAVIIATAAMATYRNHQQALIDWRIVAFGALGAAAAAYFGTELMHGLSNQTLNKLFAVTLVVIGVKMWFSN